MITITEIDWFRAAIANAMVEDMTVYEIWECLENAKDAEAFDRAINLMALMKGQEQQ